MKAHLKQILQKIVAAAADDRPPVLTEIMDIPALEDRELIDLLGSWIPRQWLLSGSNINLDGIFNDATIITPDLDNPDIIAEYYQWIENQSKCYYKPSGEGDAPEAIFGLFGVITWGLIHGFFSQADLQVEWVERNETPVVLPPGRDKLPQSIAEKIAVPPSHATGLDIGDLEGKTPYEIRMAICKSRFLGVPDLPTHQHNARARFLQEIKERIIGRVDEGSAKYITLFGYKPATTPNGRPLGLTPLGQAYVENQTNDLLGAAFASCNNALIQIIASTPNLAIYMMNTYFEFWTRRTNQLLRLQALLYIGLIQTIHICSEATTDEEYEKCIACGDLVEQPISKPPIEPLDIGCTDPLTCPEYESYHPIFPPVRDVYREHYERQRRNPY